MRLSVAALLVAALSVAACSRPPAPPEPVRAVRVVTVEAEGTTARHEYAADVRARTESRLAFRVGGKLVQREVDLGATVRAGQTLARLDPGDLRLGQAAAQAAVTAAEVAYRQAESDLRRFQELRQQGFISSAELERHETASRSSRAQLEQAQAQARVQGNQAGYARLVADVGGVVTGIDAEPGSVLAAGAPVLRLAHDGPRDVVFAVPEDRVAGLRQLVAAHPESLRVRLWGAGAQTIPAALREVAAAADPATRTFLVKADVGRAAVRLGQTATVIIDPPAVQRAIKLPLTAIWEHQGGSAVWVLDRDAMTVQPRPVQVAGADGNDVVIAAGLQPGQTVVTAGVHVLTPGQKVKLYAQRTADALPPPVAR